MAQNQQAGPSKQQTGRVGPPVERKEAQGPAVSSQVFQCCKDSDHNHPPGLDPHRKGSLWSITNMPADIAKYAIDAPINFDAKKDDIERHKKDEQLDPFQRSILCLKSTEVNQKVYAAESLFALMLQDENKAFKELVPGLESDLKTNLNPEYHEAASDSFTKCINELLKKNPARGKQLVQTAASLAVSANPDISNAWYKCFDTLVDLLSSADLQREVVPQIVERFGKESSTSNGKRVAAKLINKLTKRVPEEVVAKKLVPVVETLCEDRDKDVRGLMCVLLPEVIVKLKNKDRMFPILNKFMSDTEPIIMSALIGALGKTITLINPKDPQANAFFGIAIPVIKKVVKKAYVDKNTSILTQFSAHMGQMTSIFSGAGMFSSDDKLWFLDAYLQLSRYGLPLTYHNGKGNAADMPTGFMNFRANMEFNRRHSLIETLISSSNAKPGEGKPTSTAATLALLKGNNNNANTSKNAATGLGGAGSDGGDGWICRANAANGFFHFLKFAKPLVDFRSGLHPMIIDLMHDPVPSVRAKMAENIYPIMNHLGVDGALLNGEVVYALSDDNMDVVEAIVPKLADILRNFVQAKLISPDTMTNAMVEIGGALLFCEERLSQTNDWRVHAMMLEQMAVLPFCLPGDYVFNNFVPALFHRLLHMRQLPCRIAAADAIVAFLRHCRRSNQREELRKKLKEGFAQGRSVHDRLLFLFMSKKIMDMFSRKYYRDHFFETTLALTDDNVANIRLKAVNMMPDLKGVLQLSDNSSLLKKLEETLVRIKNSETDRDVQNAIDAVIPEMAKIGVVLRDEKRGPKTKEDLEDEAKEREEAYIASLEPPSGNPNSKEKRKSLFKSSKRHSDPPKPPTQIKPPAPVVQQPQQPGPVVPAPLAQGSGVSKNDPLHPTDNAKLALQMKGHTFSKPPPAAESERKGKAAGPKSKN